jgi:DNA-binding MarR family transcriptional regulator
MASTKRSESRAPVAKHEDEILLGVLDAVHRESAISQRTISKEVGVALGLANAYLKRAVRKGWVKVRQAPPRRYLYYLTPQGFAEKTRLSSEYLSSSFGFFRRARAQTAESLAYCQAQGWKRVVFVGCSDLAEVGIICAHEASLELLGVIDENNGTDRFCGMPVFKSLEECPAFDALVMTTLEKPWPVYERLQAKVDPSRILVPKMLRMAMPAESGNAARGDKVEVAV